MSMPHGLVVRRDWLPRLLAGEVAYVVKASKTMRRGTVYLVESGTGRVAAAATYRRTAIQQRGEGQPNSARGVW